MEYNQKLTDALLDISIVPAIVGDPDGMRGLLEDKLDEAKYNVLEININGLKEDVIITRGELGYLNKVEYAYSLFMETYQEYLDNQSIINIY